MNHVLLDWIEPARRRLRSVWFWWSVAAIAAALTLVAIALDRWLLSSTWAKMAAGRLPGAMVITFLIAALAAWFYVRWRYADPRGVAGRIESRFPELEQRLLTALSQSDQAPGYLQQRVIQEVKDHSRAHDWSRVVPRRPMMFSRLCGLGASAVLLFVLGRQAVIDSAAPAPLAGPDVAIGTVTVEPGDTELERGTSLVVTARFPGTEVPESARLIRIDAAGQQQIETMSRNLSDPVWGVFLSSVTDTFRYRVVTPNWSSAEFSVDVFEYPALVRSDANLGYPDYTQLPERRIEDTVRVAAIEGTRVTWICYVNKQVERAVLVDEAGEQTPLLPDPAFPGAVVATLELRETERRKLQLTDAAGRHNKFPPELIARVLPNQPPQLRLTAFGDVTVSPLEELPLEAQVSDDVGVAQVGLSYSLDGASANEIVLGTDVPRAATASLRHLVELEKLRAEPDQLFAYHFWAEDVGPDGELRRTNSDLFFAEVRPLEQIFREGQPPAGGEQPQPAGGQQAAELAELQKEIINGTWRVIREHARDSASQTLSESIDLLVESQQTALSQLQAVASQVRDPESQRYVEQVAEQMRAAVTSLESAAVSGDPQPLNAALRAEQMAYAGLLKLRTREFQVSRNRSAQGQSGGASQGQLQQQLNQLELEQDENRYEAERKAQAASQEEQQQREIRQILSRLRELARRQQDVNQQLAELQSALQQAQTEQEQQEIQRRLKRLREQQQDLLRQTDELAERMQQGQQREQLRQANEQLRETRQHVQQASQALQQQQPGQALSAGRRAERQFEEMRDEFRRQAAGQFDEALQQMRDAAQQIQQQQADLSQRLSQLDDPQSSPGLRSDANDQAIEDRLQQQRDRLESLLQQMQQTVEEAEVAEPLLAQNLYEAFRRTRQQQVDQQLQQTSELVQQGFVTQARQVERQAGAKLEELKQDIDQAAESVLGEEAKALERALAEVEALDREVTREITAGRRQATDTADPADVAEASTEGSDPSAGPASGSPPDPSLPAAASQSAASESAASQSAAAGSSAGPAAEADQRDLSDLFPSDQSAPIAGDGFRDWSDRLRDVEEMVGDPQLRNRAAQIRDRARGIRRDLSRNDQPPRWELVEELIARPLRELRREIAQQLLRRSADRNASVPIDRDPVPAQFSDAVRRYYESLGSGSP